jgi:cytochrome c-type protein NapB
MIHPDKGSSTVYTIFSRFPKFVAVGALAILSVATASAIFIYLPDHAGAQVTGEVRPLRGETEIPEVNHVPDIERQDTRSGRFERAYRQQPPLIPHKIQGYQISRTVNQCVQCHDWPYNVDQGAPKISETHYYNREGVALDRVAPNRWFCTQCHVPQSNAKELVNNAFTPATDLD